MTLPPRSQPRPETVSGSPPGGDVDRGAEGAQAVEHRLQRPLAGARVAVEVDVAVGQRGERGQEAHHGAGEADVDRGGPVERGRA